MTDFLGGLTIKRGDGGGSEVFTAILGLFSAGGFGKTNSLVEVTDFDGGTTREYIAGLSDGSEISFEFNEDIDGATNTQLVAMVDDVDNQTTRNMQIVQTDGTNTDTYDFAVVPLSWVKNPSVDDRNTITIGLKITGDITKS